MSRSLHPLRTFVMIFSVLCGTAAMAQNGIFADFTTSMGNFTCKLDFTNAPKAVANFIGLATGQRAWLDGSSSLAHTNPFYNGLKFHRVIRGFMIQGGSYNGLGTDNPGYAFPDEFTTKLRFNAFGKLAMANSGPKSNGSQFFITVEPTTWLNDVHTIFGWVTQGSNVVYNISRVATDTNDVPRTNVVIQNITIRRLGTRALNFDIEAQNLPKVQNVALGAAAAGSDVALSFTNRQYCDNRLFTSTNLVDWSAEGLGIEIANAGTNRVLRTASGPRGFYSLAQVQYASSTFAPRNLFQRTLKLFFNGGGVITSGFDTNGGGTYTFPPNPSGTITNYTYVQEPYRAFLSPVYYSGNFYMSLRLDFKSNTNGTFSGGFYSTTSGGVGGAFTLTP